MLWNLLEANENSKGSISTWKGLNRKYKGNNGEFYDMENMSSDGYPCMVPRRMREKLYDEYGNIRLLIKPLNKDLTGETPGFCGIVDGTDEAKFIYNGEEIGIDYNTFPNDFVYLRNDTQTYVDRSSLFPMGEGTKYTYAYLNQRLFIFINNSEKWGEIDGQDADSDGLPVSVISGNTITLPFGVKDETEKETLQNKMLHRNISLQASYVHNWGGSDKDTIDYDIRYYITGVTVGDTTTTITVSQAICQNPYRFDEGDYPTNTDWTLYPVKDSIKMYYDAGKSEQKLKNMERGLYNFSYKLLDESHTVEETGISYSPCCAIEVLGGTDTKATVKEYIHIGDRVKLRGCGHKKNNTVVPDDVYQKIDDDDVVSATVIDINYVDKSLYKVGIYLQFINAEGEVCSPIEEKAFNHYYTQNETPRNYFLSISKIVPNLSSAVSHNQRLWGVNPNGQYYYASAVSDPFTWYGGSYGTESAPLEIQADTEDEYTGIVDFGQYVILMKPTSLQQIYCLASASTMSITRAMYNVGCIDAKSAVVIGSTLYYLGYNGFYSYSGGAPEIISAKLNTRYVSATAITDGVKYYASAVDTNGDCEFVVYDTQYGVWHKEDNLQVTGGYIWYDKPIVATDTRVYRLNAGGDYDSGFEWMAESIVMFEGTMDNKAVNDIWLRARIPEGETVTLSTRVNGGEWKEHTALKGTGNIKIYRVPVRAINAEYYEFKLQGTGDAVIYDMERKLNIEGRPYKN